jgi:uncharacterized membrane protein (UPF0127 family)
MKVLRNSKDQTVLVPRLSVAESLSDRTRGLLGRDGLSNEEGLWILRCNSIHTFFMRFAIDCVFLNRKCEVVSVKTNVRPWRLIVPQWGATSVIEVSAGVAQTWKLQKGDTLYVGA